MISKMKAYAEKGSFREALIIGQNIFARNSGDVETFKAYASVLESVMDAEDTLEGKIRYFQQLSSTLTVFSESVDMDDGMVSFVMYQENRLEKLFGVIQQLQMQEKREFVKKKIMANYDILEKLSGAMEKLRKAADRASFDAVLQQVQQYDAALDKSYLTDRQKNVYDSATQQCPKIIDVKLHAFRRAADVAYNEQALEAYERVFCYFKDGKNLNDHESVVRGLFGFDPGRLFNETLNYYNHVYAYVLSKMNDDEKLILTKAAIHSEIGR